MGNLHLIIGPMFSGKTSKLVSIFRTLRAYDESVCIINYAKDQRYSDNKMSTHDNIHLDCIMTETLSCLDEETIKKYNVFLINEGQFFTDLYEVIMGWVETHDKTVYVAALDGDYKREGFTQVMRLVPLCDSIDKLSAVCKSCMDGTPAIFSKRTVVNDSRILIGSSNEYISVCRRCYSREIAFNKQLKR